ncbi:MAG: Unknown protein [uncultured Sulfurovum sp.]|uniref:CRISPR-associated protein Cas6 C-terminal domain-containing protein n=1 Tax=uncultured Sulfurovum sp. TaxID=269237 RepID=A0A6S6S869_9BACT|nr:MAG: Unknown protein [uncultured Sulfurovum sp.]
MKYSYLQIKTNSTKKPKEFVGATIRGTFGHQLKEQVCMEPSYKCDGCVYQNTCLSYALYPLKDDSLRTFRMDVRLHQNNYDFGLYLFGDFSKDIRIIIQVLYTMLLSHRLTINELSFPKSQVFYNGKELKFNKNHILEPFKYFSQTLLKTKHHQDLVIHLLTPTYIKYKGSYKKELSVEDIVKSIIKRKHYFETREMVHKIEHSLSFSSSFSELRAEKVERVSTRQGKKLFIEGVVGKVTVKGLDEESYHLLKWGEVVGVGKGTAFGGGAIKIET